MNLLRSSAFAATLISSTAFAVPVTFFDTISGGQTSFTNTVTGSGASVNSLTLTGLSYGNSWDMGDFAIANADGGYSSVYSASADGNTGQMIGINPAGSGTDPSGYKDSGITFTFDTAINALGFEVGDWGTCCHPSSLFIQFDGGATQTVGTANSYSDNPAIAAGLRYDGIFVGAIDDSDTFTSVTFWGDGVGEILTAGGTIMWSTVDIGSIAVPEPASLALFGLGLAGLGVARRKQNAQAAR